MDEVALDKAWEEIAQDANLCKRCGAEVDDDEAMKGYNLCGWCEHVTYKSIDN